jgi:hypothetical protein
VGSSRRVCRQYLSNPRDDRQGEPHNSVAWLSKEIAKNAATGYGNCSTETEAVFSTARFPVKDDLQRFHEKNMASDPQYAIARHLLDLGEAVAQLRAQAKMTRGQLGKRLRVKARDIAIVEEETPRAPAGLLEAALSLLVQMLSVKTAQPAAVSRSIRTIRNLRPALVSAA